MPKLKQKKEIQEPLRMIMRAQSRIAQENAAKPSGSQAPRDRQEEPKQKQARSAIGPNTSSPIQRDE